MSYVLEDCTTAVLHFIPSHSESVSELFLEGLLEMRDTREAFCVQSFGRIAEPKL